jgi:hypothetical protein
MTIYKKLEKVIVWLGLWSLALDRAMAIFEMSQAFQFPRQSFPFPWARSKMKRIYSERSDRNLGGV